MVFLLLCDDLPQRIRRFVIHSVQRPNLLLHMAEDDPFDSDRCSKDRIAAR